MREVKICRGLPASGKSTAAKAWVEEQPHGRSRTNKDDIRRLLHASSTEDSGYTFGKQNEAEVIALRNAAITNALKLGKSIVVDDTHIGDAGQKHFDTIREMAKVIDPRIQVSWWDFTDVDMATCIERNAKRDLPYRVPEDVIRRMHAQLTSSTDKDRQAPQVPYDPHLPDCIICDIDGTIAHMNGGRGPYDWAKVGQDAPDQIVMEIVQSFARSHVAEVVVFSGRDAVCKSETARWLEDYEFSHIMLEMRPEGSQTKDDDVKQKMYEDHIKGKFNVIAVFDDRNQVVKRWRELGLKCLQVAEGNF